MHENVGVLVEGDLVALRTVITGTHKGEYAANAPTAWAIFNAYLNGAADQAAQAVTPNWIDKLGGADVYTWSNAYAAIESLRIDYGSLGPFGIRP